MGIDVMTPSAKSPSGIHPSKIHRQKLAEQKKLRLAEALRENLRKRKEQVRNRKDEG